jgi:hypothetical protein
VQERQYDSIRRMVAEFAQKGALDVHDEKSAR